MDLTYLNFIHIEDHAIEVDEFVNVGFESKLFVVQQVSAQVPTIIGSDAHN